ncbi:antibiotic biosynthesis monooxygenase [Streptomyces sp. HNM0574]|uniref:antibiotic biosynthesis monooxygenase n=1 Tax=Streptomyces sp. HNM0574 TaxID=2714954 RepID=UPI00146A6F57|nr:hypothetical protein [Streptomyces sp. HNM0574]
MTFCTLHARDRAAGEELARTIRQELRQRVRHARGFARARVHLSQDGTTTVVRGEWASEADHREALGGPAGEVLRGLAERPAVQEAHTFSGVPVPGLDGPDAGRLPGVVCVATRHVGTAGNAHRLAGLLRSGEWKRGFPGFISAEPFISHDGGTYVNYPQWVDEAAFAAYMADPRNQAGQPDIADLEVAPPQLVMCTVVEEVRGPEAAG